MASTFRRAALEKHSSASLDHLSFCCRTCRPHCHRLAELAEEILFERQLANAELQQMQEVLVLLPY